MWKMDETSSWNSMFLSFNWAINLSISPSLTQKYPLNKIKASIAIHSIFKKLLYTKPMQCANTELN